MDRGHFMIFMDPWSKQQAKTLTIAEGCKINSENTPKPQKLLLRQAQPENSHPFLEAM